MSAPTFTAGRDMTVASASGDNSSATVTITKTTAPNKNVDIEATLLALREILIQLPDIGQKAITRIDEARDEARKPEPNRGEVKKLVVQAAAYAREVEGFADAAEKLKPHLLEVASWLGSTWQSWAPALGLG